MQRTLPIGKKLFRGNLFSAHYLENKLPRGDYWRGIEEKNDEAYDKIKELYEEKADFLERFDESQLEDDFIRPVLKFLGHVRDVQPPILTPAGVENRPDYAFFGSEEAKRKAIELRNARNTDEYYKLSIGIGEAKHWNVELDRGRQENPSVKISKYLRLSLAPWGILTNGKYWRIYSKKEGFSSNSYYEVNLPRLLEHGTQEDFKYFHGFFSQQAFVKEDGQCFLDRVYNGSIKFAKRLEYDLRKNVYKCLKKFSTGFLESNSNLSPTNENIKEIHKNTLILLYRFLFIFYAEARGLLPLDNIHYKNYSIQKIREKIAKKLDRNEPFAIGTGYWNYLTLLFKLLNVGAKGLGVRYNELPVPPYNGGLFKPEEYPFLEKYTINDKYLAEAIDLLSRRGGEGGRGYVDYSTLSIRHLGSIYEGLLEYKLKIAEDDLVEDKEKGKDVYRRAEDGESPDVSKGEIYLETDKGERKATGSYYTPGYIVAYIVENTLEPVIEEKAKKVRNNGDLLDELLSIKVLDPAMGSGHFLVEATNFLANKIVEKLEEAGSKEIPELNEIKRSVAERCIYGVDLNPLATELAKVSLWLETVANDKPLSFLDHHLQCGNSLIGAHFEDLATAKDKSQVTIFSNTFNTTARQMIKKRMQIEKLSSDTIKKVEKKEELYKEVTQLRQRFKEVLDIHTSKYFGNNVLSSELNNLIMSIGKDEKTWDEFRSREWFKKALKISEEKRFFNWELRFPEIFFDKYGAVRDNPGYDGVVGNPPYVNMDIVEKDLSRYLEKTQPEIWMGQTDIYYFFIKKGIDLLKFDGQFSYITSRYFLESHFARGIRNFISTETSILKIIDFSNFDVFGGVGIDSSILVFQKGRKKENKIIIYRNPNKLSITDSVDIENKLTILEVEQDSLNKEKWVLIDKKINEILLKFDSVHYSTVGSFCIVGMGMQTGANEVFKTSEREIREFGLPNKMYKKVISNSNIERFYIDYQNRYWLYLEKTNEEGIENYPKLKRRFEDKKELLKNRISFKRGDCLWFRYAYPRFVEYYDKPKLITSYLSKQNRFGVDNNGEFYSSTDSFIVVPIKNKLDILYLASVLNSTLLDFIYKQYGKLKGGGLYEYSKHNIERLPICRINFTIPKEVRLKLVEELKSLYSQNNIDSILTKTDECLSKATKGNFVTEKEKSGVVHDFLAFLAEQMIGMKKKEHKLEDALDLFKYLPYDIETKKFRWLFEEEIKYGRGLDQEILKGYDEINDFRLEKEGDEWILEVELKLRDSENPKNFLKEGNKIKKKWYKIYAFDMDDKKAEYYQSIFENLTDFENAKIPSGYKKRAKEKLFQTLLPVFDDEKVKAMKPYLEVWEELLELREKIEKTDLLIDQIVYKLYGLRDEEIKIVEGAVK